MNLAQKIIVTFINLYQSTFSPDHGWLRARYPYGFCRFYPSCSEYAKQSIIKYGASRGTWLGLRRIIRCNPWTSPVVDPTP